MPKLVRLTYKHVAIARRIVRSPAFDFETVEDLMNYIAQASKRTLHELGTQLEEQGVAYMDELRILAYAVGKEF